MRELEGRKLKNIALLILVLTNLCLLAFVLQRELQDRYFSWQTRSNAIRLLTEGKGVELEEGLVPDQITLTPQKVERDLELESTLAAGVLGGTVQAENRGAGVYRYFNQNGSLQFHSDGTFSGEFTAGAFPLGDDRVQACLSLLEELQFQGQLLEEEEGELVFRQLWQDVPLFNQQVTMVVSDGCLVAMAAGRRLAGAPEEDSSRATITPATALIEAYNGINALGYVCSRMDSIIQGYVSAASLSGPTTLTPVWRVVTDTGEYQLNLVTGEVTRVT